MPSRAVKLSAVLQGLLPAASPFRELLCTSFYIAYFLRGLHMPCFEALNSSPTTTTTRTRLVACYESCRATTCPLLYKGSLELKLQELSLFAELGRGVVQARVCPVASSMLNHMCLIEMAHSSKRGTSTSLSSTRPVAAGVSLQPAGG